MFDDDETTRLLQELLQGYHQVNTKDIIFTSLPYVDYQQNFIQSNPRSKAKGINPNFSPKAQLKVITDSMRQMSIDEAK